MRSFPTRVSVTAIFSVLVILMCVFLSIYTNDTLSKPSANTVSSDAYSGVAVPHYEQYYRVTTEKKDNKASAPPSVPQGTISVINGLVSVNLDTYSLLAALNDVSHRSGVPIIADIQDRLISLQAEDVSLEQGIQLLTRGLDILSFHDGATGSLKSVWAYEAGTYEVGKGNLVSPPELWMTNGEMQRQLTNPNPEERARAAEILIERGKGQAMDWVLQALRDPVDVVRYRTLQKILDEDLSLPQEVLREIISYDPSPLARFITLNIISASIDQKAAKELVEIALNDMDVPVSNHARDVLFAMQKER